MNFDRSSRAAFPSVLSAGSTEEGRGRLFTSKAGRKKFELRGLFHGLAARRAPRLSFPQRADLRLLPTRETIALRIQWCSIPSRLAHPRNGFARTASRDQEAFHRWSGPCDYGRKFKLRHYRIWARSSACRRRDRLVLRPRADPGMAVRGNYEREHTDNLKKVSLWKLPYDLRIKGAKWKCSHPSF